MRTKYHVNQNTGKYGPCEAKKACPLGDNAIHLEKLEDAVEYSEMVLEEKYGKQTVLKKSKAPSAKSINLSINKNYTYPEAHKLEKMDYMIFGLKGGEVTPAGISSIIGTKERVSHYYAEAACFLGIAESVVGKDGKKAYSLTQNGENYIKQDKEGRQDILKRAINSIDIIQDVKRNNEKDVLKAISESHGESLETSDRKFSSMKSWAKQIDQSAFLYEVKAEDVENKLAEGLEMYEKQSPLSNSAPKEKQGELCMSCFMVKPVTNVCPNCDE